MSDTNKTILIKKFNKQNISLKCVVPVGLNNHFSNIFQLAHAFLSYIQSC